MLADYLSHETVPLNIDTTFMFKSHWENWQMVGKFILDSSATFLSIIKINMFIFQVPASILSVTFIQNSAQSAKHLSE